jgi:hypothetical protein
MRFVEATNAVSGLHRQDEFLFGYHGTERTLRVLDGANPTSIYIVLGLIPGSATPLVAISPLSPR